MGIKKRLDVLISAEVYDYIREGAKRAGQPMNFVANQLLTQAVAQQCSTVVEQQSLPAIREIVSTEFCRSFARFETELREDIRRELLEEVRSLGWGNNEQAETFLLRAVSEARAARKMLYALIAHLVSPQFAAQVLSDTKKKNSESAPPRTVSEGA